ncbi:MAG: malonate-semialdehyde dehydrogenase (acetylating) / methylmalonate-semialdehyde dehydrogenase [Acidobacteriota bacterium]|jgi:malonate-semialdehyde dehydrogenase (acetylating)/methylmalonate-semialdehyde dehydrogenase|nr:malonate-semialdehyde dehydrogenase (acetylating) / methylmalonate-semialdehyde dehydrogenase [Acidobacteriota bacterium]
MSAIETAAPARYPDVRNYIAGQFVEAPERALLDVTDPASGGVLSRVPLSGMSEVDRAVQAAQKAFPGWSATPIKERVQVFYRYKALLEKNIHELAALVSEENGKVRSEAEAEVLKSAELCEFATSLPQIIPGEVLEVSRGVECRVERYPVGVVASITPFNFPNMVPNWTIPNAIAVGNCMILKPSEQVPLSAGRIAELLREAGLPDGVLNVVHGGQETVEAICDHPGIEAISFVGSTHVAKIVYRRGSANLKRVLALGGAKNHLIVMPDAEPEMTSTNVVASMSGCAGQRCMAASVMMAVGATDHIVERMANIVRAMVPGVHLGPVISKAAKERIERYITEAEEAGAKVLVDGRGYTVPGKEGGYFVGPTLIDRVTPDMRIAQEEVFGPVMVIVRADDVQEAVRVQRRSPYGNAASVFTESGSVARYVMENASAGMVGVNVGVPVPREPFGFGGWNDSKFGTGDITGRGSIEFWTKSKKMTTKWNKEAGVNWMS